MNKIYKLTADEREKRNARNKRVDECRERKKQNKGCLQFVCDDRDRDFILQNSDYLAQTIVEMRQAIMSDFLECFHPSNRQRAYDDMMRGIADVGFDAFFDGYPPPWTRPPWDR